jgi:putative ABC transport system permease protein
MIRRVQEGWHRLRSLLRRSNLERGLADEIRFHVDQQTEKNRRAGMPPDEARRQALVRFGGVERAREGARDEFRFVSAEDILRDLRYGARALRRAPGFTIVALLTLALGIGATTAMFSVVNGVLLRPLPYPDQDRLIELVHEAPVFGAAELFASPAIYFAYRDHSRTFESVGLWDWDNSPVTVSGSGEPEAVASVEVTHEVLRILGAEPVIGRGFRESDDVPGSPATAVISHAYWQRRFGGADPLGRTLVVDGIPREVIGVMPPSFRFFEYPADIFYPRQPVRTAATFPSFDGRAVARVKPGVTLSDANADVARMIPILIEEYGRGTQFDSSQLRPRLRWLKETVVGDLDDTLWLLMGTIGLLLAIACANVANLVLARTETRRPELAVRTALGAGRAAIARAVFLESVVLGLAGGLAGLAVAYLSLPVLLSLGSADLPQIMTVAIDFNVLLVALGASVLATVGFAAFPMVTFASAKLHPADSLRGGGRSTTEGRDSHRARHLLIAAQVALALVLLIGAGLMIRTFQTLRQVDPGFHEPEDVLTFQLTMPSAGPPAGAPANAPRPEHSVRIKQAIAERLAAVPGVQSAAFSAFNDGLPLDGDGRSAGFVVEGRPAADERTTPREIQYVSPQFFETLQTPLIAGRTFDWTDVYGDRRLALVSENMARAEWGSAAAAIGKRFGPGARGPWWEVIGVVKDVHHNGLSQPPPQMAIIKAVASETASFVVRSDRVGTAGFLEELQRAVWSVNGALSLANVRTLGDMYRGSMARTSMTLMLLAITGTMALLLGLIGIYGVVNYSVSQRRREIGIRLALGAAQGEIRRMFVGRALVPVCIGVAIGLAAAAGLTRVMASQLFGVSPLDPLTHAAVALGLVTAAALASYLSAKRASALDPVTVLKGD